MRPIKIVADSTADLPKELRHAETKRVKYNIELKSNSEITQLFSMTPYFYRTDEKGFERLAALERLTTEIDVLCDVYIKD